MQKFSFTEKKDILIPNTSANRPFYNKDGKELTGDETLRMMSKMVTEWEKKTERPVPIPEQKFIGWLKQASNLLDKGESSEEIFSKTIIGGGL